MHVECDIPAALVKAYLRDIQRGVFPNPQELCKRLKIQSDIIKTRWKNLAMCTNKNGDTPLLTAARYGQLRILETLHVDYNVTLEHTNADGKTALHEAAQTGHLECVSFLIRSGAHVDSLKKADWTPLMLACTKDKLSVVETLVMSGASLSLTNKDGWTPFHIACREGHCDIINFLLDIKPNCWNTKSKNLRTPLHTAALHCRSEAVRILLRRCGHAVDCADSSGVTPLMDAAKGGHIEVAQLLLHDCKDSIESVDSQGRQPLHHASQTGATNTVKLLVAEGAKINAKTSETERTALHYAAKEGHTGALTQLLTLGADPTLTDKTGKTALDVARYARDSQNAVTILENSLAEKDRNTKQRNPARTTITQLSPPHDFRTELEHDMRVAFTSQPMNIQSKYHYDKIGSMLFEDITKLPQYYLTRVETGILTERAKEIMQIVAPNELVELGSGSSTKTRLLLEAMYSTGGNRYVAIEISETALYQAAEALSTDYEWLEIEGHVGNYHTDLPLLKKNGKRLLTFLGSSLGNYTGPKRKEFLEQIGKVLKKGDALLLGIDLVKDEEMMVLAYNDPTEVTARFNTNLLNMINRELDANFEVQHFKFCPQWSAEKSGVESHLVAQRDMTVTIRALNLTFKLSKGDKIMTEISCKFTREGITCELAKVGLEVTQWYTDSDDMYGLLIACPK